MNLITNWQEVKIIFRNSFRSSFHFAMATVSENGEPHVTPIGSLILDDPGHGLYFEEFTQRLPTNLRENRKVCVLAVNSNRWFWLRSLIKGRFISPPAIRLHGVAGYLREANEKEIALWQNRVKPLRFSAGHAMMWRNMKMVRDIQFTRIEPVHMGRMTANTWSRPAANACEEKSRIDDS